MFDPKMFEPNIRPERGLRRPARVRIAALAVAILLGFAGAATQMTQAQTFTNLHNFTNQADGGWLFAGPAMDRAGNIYSAAQQGGAGYNGTVFQMSQRNGSWTLDTLHAFQGGDDGSLPVATPTVGPDGSLYGTTFSGGGGCNGSGCGTVFKLARPPRVCTSSTCRWTETVLYNFAETPGMSTPFGGVTFDSAGNLYGTTYFGGSHFCGDGDCGVVYELSNTGGNWTFQVLYNFSGGADGAHPMATMAIDQAGNLYGTTFQGSVFELVRSGSGWTENTLYTFQNGPDGGSPQAGVVFDNAGNLYGATTKLGGSPGGVVYKLTHSGSSWTYAVLYTYRNSGGIYGNVAVDSAGNIYGASLKGGINMSGTVFKLTNSGGVWSLTDLHDLEPGSYPQGNVLLDPADNLYGTTITGGQYGRGSLWQIQHQ
jgi:uncharacterized repeat protein (TIGR03803 family)